MVRRFRQGRKGRCSLKWSGALSLFPVPMSACGGPLFSRATSSDCEAGLIDHFAKKITEILTILIDHQPDAVDRSERQPFETDESNS